MVNQLCVIQNNTITKQQLGKLAHHDALQIVKAVNNDVVLVKTLDRIAHYPDANQVCACGLDGTRDGSKVLVMCGTIAFGGRLTIAQNHHHLALLCSGLQSIMCKGNSLTVCVIALCHMHDGRNRTLAFIQTPPSAARCRFQGRIRHNRYCATFTT